MAYGVCRNQIEYLVGVVDTIIMFTSHRHIPLKLWQKDSCSIVWWSRQIRLSNFKNEQILD